MFSTSFLCSANMWRVTTTISFYVFLYKPRANIDESFKMNEQIADGEMEQAKRVREIAIIPADSYFSDRSMRREGVVRGGE